MKKISLLTLLVITFSFAMIAVAQRPTKQKQIQQEKKTMQAKGTFDVKVIPLDEQTPESVLMRMSIDKQFHGELEGTSKGQMLAGGGTGESSGVYVAIEKVTGKLNGRSGSFYLHHTGIMEKGVPTLNVSVVPDSGTEELKGLKGKLTIKIEGKQHFYEFEYSLPE